MEGLSVLQSKTRIIEALHTHARRGHSLRCARRLLLLVLRSRLIIRVAAGMRPHDKGGQFLIVHGVNRVPDHTEDVKSAWVGDDLSAQRALVGQEL